MDHNDIAWLIGLQYSVGVEFVHCIVVSPCFPRSLPIVWLIDLVVEDGIQLPFRVSAPPALTFECVDITFRVNVVWKPDRSDSGTEILLELLLKPRAIRSTDLEAGFV